MKRDVEAVSDRWIRQHRQALVISVVGVVVVMATIAIVSLTTNNRNHSRDRALGKNAQGQTSDLTAPTCAPSPTTPKSDITISAVTRGATLDSECYYAAADRPIDLTFNNGIVAQLSGQPTTLTLAISRGDNPLMNPAPDVSAPIRFGSTEDATFVSAGVTAPSSAEFDVPALPAGDYAVQILELPDALATLVVQQQN